MQKKDAETRKGVKKNTKTHKRETRRRSSGYGFVRGAHKSSAVSGPGVYECRTGYRYVGQYDGGTQTETPHGAQKAGGGHGKAAMNKRSWRYCQGS